MIMKLHENLLNISTKLNEATIHRIDCRYASIGQTGAQNKPLETIGVSGGWFRIVDFSEAEALRAKYIPTGKLLKCKACKPLQN